jgi:hypothetical protein
VPSATAAASIEAPADEPPTDTETEGSTVPAESSTADGSRDHPFPIGTTITGREWDVTVNSVTLAATDQVMAANQFNDPPPEGQQYALVNITATYHGEDSSYAWVSVKYVAIDGTTSDSGDSFAVAPDDFDSLQEVYTGASITGNIDLLVPVEAPEQGVLSVTPDVLGDKVFVSVV